MLFKNVEAFRCALLKEKKWLRGERLKTTLVFFQMIGLKEAIARASSFFKQERDDKRTFRLSLQLPLQRNLSTTLTTFEINLQRLFINNGEHFKARQESQRFTCFL